MLKIKMVYILALLLTIEFIACKKETAEPQTTTAAKTDSVKTSTQTVVGLPIVKTGTLSNISQTTAMGAGSVLADSNLSVTARGLCWSVTYPPTLNDSHSTDSTGIGSFTTKISGLNTSTKYFVRAYATNSKGTSFGDSVSFWSLAAETPIVKPDTVVDIDGNVYKTLKIGSQTWMTSNLKVTRFANGDSVSLKILSKTDWENLSDAARCYFNNDAGNALVYGAMYNGMAVADSRKLCPVGWHVPDTTEWFTMAGVLGGRSVAGGKLKEKGTSHWLSPNTDASDEFGFTALGGGDRYWDNDFENLGIETRFWTPTFVHADGTGNGRKYIYLRNDSKELLMGQNHKANAYYVRCVKD